MKERVFIHRLLTALLILALALPLAAPASAAETIYLSTTGEAVYLPLRDIASQIGGTLDYVTHLRLSSSSSGSLYYDYRGRDEAHVSYSTRYFRDSSLYLDRISFVPSSGYSGTARVTMDACNTAGRSYEIVLSIDVDTYGRRSSDSYRYGSGDLSYTTSGKPVFLSPGDIASHLGITLDYISNVYLRTPSSGSLYYDYRSDGDHNVTVSRYANFYRSASGSDDLIERVCYVPEENFTGTAEIYFTAYDSRGRSYDGTVYIQAAAITYETDGKPLHLSGADLADHTGLALSYAAFSVRSAASGTLYYNYTDRDINEGTVASGTRYYLSGSPAIDKVYFVPAPGFTGNAEISFTAYDASGKSRSGTILLRVTDTDSDTARAGAGTIVYHVGAGRSVWLNRTDFDNQCRSQTGNSLSSLTFLSLPSTAEGTLYSGSGTSSAAAINRSYAGVGNLRFAASAGFTGSVTVRYTGRSSNSREYEGTIRFDVTADSSDGLLNYTAEPNRRVYFRLQDFSDACRSATGYDIDHIHFESLPSASQGTLYSGTDTVVRVAMGQYYYRSSLNDLNFYAAGGFSGVTIPFTGYAEGYSSYSSGRRDFTGTITIHASGSAAGAVNTTTSAGSTLNYSTTGLAVQLGEAELLNAAVRALSTAPETIRLSAPPAESGRLCLDFVSLSRYTPFEDQKSYGVSDISRIYFLPKSGFRGTAAVNYTMTDATGKTCAGEIRFTVSPPTVSSYFYDMGDCPWAVPAVDFFYSYGAVNGNSRSAFGPSADMKRGDFVLLLSRAFSFPAAGQRAGFTDVPGSAYYAAAIDSAAELGILGGSSATLFEPDRVISREEAAMLIYRCLRRVTSITPGTFEDLTGFSDCGNASPGAIPALGALVRMGVFNGDAGRLRPRMPLSRAETITILYRALT